MVKHIKAIENNLLCTLTWRKKKSLADGIRVDKIDLFAIVDINLPPLVVDVAANKFKFDLRFDLVAATTRCVRELMNLDAYGSISVYGMGRDEKKKKMEKDK